MSSVNVEQREAEVFTDHRVNPLARRVAKTLAVHFREASPSQIAWPWLPWEMLWFI